MKEILFFLLKLSPAVLIPLAIVFVLKYREYKNGAYYQVTKNSYLSMCYDLGKYGEYLTYKYLKTFEKKGAKFLFNVYVPKEDGETSEIDVLMITSKGLFVFESKNYSGWIFGSEHQKTWYQTLPAGRGRSHKEHFYNPVMQNRTHIKYLKALLGEEIPMHSIITFSDRCTLKNVRMQSPDINVINRYDVKYIVAKVFRQTEKDLLSHAEINDIYSKLHPFSQVDDETKAQHVADIQKALSHTEQPEEDLPSAQGSNLETEEKNVEEESIAEIPPAANQDTPLKCPRCGGDLILRTATRGENKGNHFYGCSNYPKCKYIKSITKEP